MGRSGWDGVLFLLVIVAVIGGYVLLRPDSPPPPSRTSVPVPFEARPDPRGGGIDVSADGTRLIYPRAAAGGALYTLHRLAGGGRELAGTEGAGAPALTPDGSVAAFVYGTPPRLTLTSLDEGGARESGPLARVAPVRFSSDGSAVFFTDPDGGISRNVVGDDDAQTVTTAEPGEEHRLGDVAEDDGVLVYEVRREGDISRIVAHSIASGTSLDLGPGEAPRVTAGGGLLFVDSESRALRLAPFDPTERIRESAPVLERIASLSPPYAVTRAGEILAARGSGAPRVTPVWVTIDGESTPLHSDWSFRGHRAYSGVALSPDESRIAWSMPSPGGSWDLYIGDVTDPLSSARRLTTEGAFNYRPHWIPGAEALVFISDRGGQADAWRLELRGGAAVRVLDGAGPIRNATYTPDGQFIVYREQEAPSADLFAQPATGGERLPVATTGDGERAPRISPDGRWVAYAVRLDEGWEIMVVPAPPTAGRRTRLSVLGGEEPMWSRDGRSLYYRSPDGQMMRLAVPDETGSDWGVAETLFDSNGMLGSDGRAQYDVTSDGRFLMLREEGPLDVELVWIENAIPSNRQ